MAQKHRVTESDFKQQPYSDETAVLKSIKHAIITTMLSMYHIGSNSRLTGLATFFHIHKYQNRENESEAQITSNWAYLVTSFTIIYYCINTWFAVGITALFLMSNSQLLFQICTDCTALFSFLLSLYTSNCLYISLGHSSPLCYALSLSWTLMRRRRATVPLATSGELA